MENSISITDTHEVVDFGPGPEDCTQGIAFHGSETGCQQWIEDIGKYAVNYRTDGKGRFGVREVDYTN